MQLVGHFYVDAVPRALAPNTLYVSPKHEVAVHLCMCGCGTKVVTPLGRGEWNLTERDGRVSLWPSVGNGTLACRSHYLITNGITRWLPPQSEDEHSRAFVRDRQDREVEIARQRPWWRRSARWLRRRISDRE